MALLELATYLMCYWEEHHVTPTCQECGAPLPEGGSCRDYFHELLALETQVSGAPGVVPHFLAVAAYNLQHPSAFMPVALAGLRRNLADVLAGRATIEDARRRARYAADGPTRVRRRVDTVVSDADQASLNAWPTVWPMTVLDVCRVPPERYVERVHQWAAAVIATMSAEREPANGAS